MEDVVLLISALSFYDARVMVQARTLRLAGRPSHGRHGATHVHFDSTMPGLWSERVIDGGFRVDLSRVEQGNRAIFLGDQ